MTETPAKLTLGPLLFNWREDKARDFYFRMADEAPVDIVYLGEVVCAKRMPFQQRWLADAAERLQAAGKEVVFSTLALISDRKDLEAVQSITAAADFNTIEANDIAAASMLAGRRFTVGPYINIYNEATLEYFENLGATRLCLPPELPASSMEALAMMSDTPLEVQVFGRLPLAISARCYHARAHKRHKDSCQYVCEKSPDGMTVNTLDDEAFLAVNGTQTLSYTYCNLVKELGDLQMMGIRHFRLSPHDADMVKVCLVFRDVLDHKLSRGEALRELAGTFENAEFSNGFYYGHEGIRQFS